MKTLKPLVGIVILLLLSSAFGAAQPYNFFWDYWVTPNTALIHYTYHHDSDGHYSSGTRYSWTGTMWGRTVVYDGGGRDLRSNSILMPFGSTVYYVSEWKGNANAFPTSTHFMKPIYWAPALMNVGDNFVTTGEQISVSPSLRSVTDDAVRTASVRLNAHYATYTVPETGVQYNDVLDFTYKPNGNAASEQYWCAKNIGWIRAINTGGADPGTVYAQPGLYNGQYCPNGVETVSGPSSPAENPWYSPICSPSSGTTYVSNGAFENGLSGWSVGGDIWLDGYPPSTPEQRTTIIVAGTQPPLQNGLDETGPHQLRMAGASVDNSLLTYVESAQLIPVIPGATYRLGGWIYRTSIAFGGRNWPDAPSISLGGGWNSAGSPVGDGPTSIATYAQGTQPIGSWYYVSVDVTMPSDVHYTKVFCTRTGVPTFNGRITASYFDDVRLQLITLPGGYVPPGI